MKKVMLFVAVAAFAATTLYSCKKDYTCTCTHDGVTYTYPMNKIKKKDAKATCNTLGALWVTAGGTCTWK